MRELFTGALSTTLYTGEAQRIADSQARRSPAIYLFAVLSFSYKCCLGFNIKLKRLIPLLFLLTTVYLLKKLMQIALGSLITYRERVSHIGADERR
ncbi:hypothetical protein ALC53_06775 [Atta colombica]|uniref:Uncharacterized protein n=1 Tax=Atta colombica TaxID=520822 RepID=A0A151I336_9HYME|nr:hypothetical protein ALC53_06775 [Atta colombica]